MILTARNTALGPDVCPKFCLQVVEESETRPAGWLAMASYPWRDADDLQQAALSVNKEVRDAAIVALKQIGVEVPNRDSGSSIGSGLADRAAGIRTPQGNVENGKKIFST